MSVTPNVARQPPSLAKPAEVKICAVADVRIDRVGKARGYWDARVPADHTIADVSRDDYFQCLLQGARVVEVGDDIEVEPVSMAFYGRLRVLGVNPAMKRVTTRVLGEWARYEETPPPGWSFEWLGKVGLWGVKKGGVLIANGFVTQTEALSAIGDLRKGVA